MSVVTRRSFKELHEQFQTYDPQYTIYRGVSKTDYKLLTTLGRLELKEERIIAQNGLFTFHPNKADEPYEETNIDKIIIPAEQRKNLKQEQYRYGIHDASMFPGLDGLTTHIKWMNESSY